MPDELETLRQKKLQEMQEQAMQEQFQHQQLQKEVAKLETLIKQRMTKEAVSRYGNVKLSHPTVALNLLGLLIQLFEKNPERTIDDEELKRLLIMINSSKNKKTNFRIIKK